jgi:isochorismate pyruvate lyase
MMKSEFQVRSPGACRDLGDLRAEIDRIDRALVGLLARRQRYIERAAEIKDRRDSVRDEARIEDVLAKVTAEAGKRRLAAGIAEAVFAVLVERSIDFELKAFDAMHPQGRP